MIRKAVYSALSTDATLTALLGTYEGSAAIFTTDPAPGDAPMPLIVATTVPARQPFDTKTTLGMQVWLDVRVYAEATGSAALIDQIAERVYDLLHRQTLTFDNRTWILSECTGPISVDESDAYGRIITLRVIAENN